MSRLSLCQGCHDTQIDEWKTSGHANAAGGDIDAFNEEHYTISSCNFCHTSEGYARVNDPALLTYEFDDEFSFVGCPTCHDPHVGEMGGGNEAQLRNVGPVTLSYTFPWEPSDEEAATMEGYGAGQTCAQCHKARRNNANVAGQIADRLRPLRAAQQPAERHVHRGRLVRDPRVHYDGDHAHEAMIGDGCVTCHMAFSEDAGGHVVHNFMPTLEACQACHPGLDEAGLAALQQPVRDKLDQIAVLMGYADWATLELTLDDDNLLWTVAQREAVYGAVFTFASGDFGVHNPDYANSLLDNAITYLTP